MGIYLPNMEMPKSCGECAIKSWDGEDDVCPFSGISALSIGRQDDCPLVPVSPHGRLIDADALAGHKFAGAEHEIQITDGGACYRRGWNDAIEAIMENAETIIGGE